MLFCYLGAKLHIIIHTIASPNETKTDRNEINLKKIFVSLQRVSLNCKIVNRQIVK